jgi:methyl-accepting chemotaxis protein
VTTGGRQPKRPYSAAKNPNRSGLIRHTPQWFLDLPATGKSSMILLAVIVAILPGQLYGAIAANKVNELRVELKNELKVPKPSPVTVTELQEEIHTYTTRASAVLIVTGLFGFFAACGAAFLASSIAREWLRELISANDAAASGDLSAHVERDNLSQIGDLQETFGQMLGSFRLTIAQIERAATDLESAAGEMSHTSDEAGHAIGEVAQAISSISEGASHQVELVTRTQHVVAEIEDKISDASEHAHQSLGQAADAHQLADEGVACAADVQLAMDQVRETSLSTAEVVRSLGDKSQDIDQIVQAITDIASQTNLLALNAAIEAARAGEQGRGFAVVAEEVRKLAEDAQGSAASIADLIKQIQAQTEQAVEAMERGVDQVEQGTQTVERNRQAFYDISAAVQTLHTGSSQIAELASGIAGGADRVRAQIEEVASVAQESSASTEQVSASTQETSAAAQQVTASAQRVEQTAVELAEIASGFKLP